MFSDNNCEAWQPSNLCPNCNRVFATKIGLGVHMRAAHPAIVNEEIDLHRVKKQWNTEELRLLAREEAKDMLYASSSTMFKVRGERSVKNNNSN